MKRFITIKGDIIFKKHSSKSWELIVKIKPEDVVPFYMELQLLASKLSSTLTVSPLNSAMSIKIMLMCESVESRISFKNKKYELELNYNDFEAISMFILKYYQNTYAPVSHLHINLDKDDDIKGNGELVILASTSA